MKEKDQDTTSTGSQGLAPGESNARAVRGPAGSAPARLRPGLTSTGGKAAAAAEGAAEDTGEVSGRAGSSRRASARTGKSKVAKRRR